MKIKNKKSNLVEFISVIDGLSEIDECLPKPTKQLMPEWWHKTEILRSSVSLDKVESGNVKNCPGLKDYFLNGYIMPMWSDLIVYYNSELQKWAYRVSDERFTVSTHGNPQYLDHVEHTTLGRNTYFVFKLESPWKIFTPDGYSTYQLPTFYHFNDDFSVAAGIRDTDRYHQMNFQLLIHSDKKEIFIPRGTPIAHLVPFKRLDLDLNVRDATQEDFKKINADELNYSTKFPGSKIYFKERQKK